MGATEREATLAPPSDSIAAALKAGEAIERHRSTPKKTDVVHAKPFVILTDGQGNEVVQYVDGQFVLPTFRKGVVHLDDAASFIAYVNRHGDPNSAIYAKMDPAKFVAVLDEHAPTAASLPEPKPQWRQFRAEFTPTLSKEWLTWIGRNTREKAFKSTEELAHFIEDNVLDVVEPSGAEMMEMALNFKVKQDVRYSNVQRLSDGHIDLQYANVVEGQATTSAGVIRMPETFKLRVPVFAGVKSDTYDIDARFRYRLAQGGVVLWYELVRPHKVLEAAFENLWKAVGEGTKKTILLGTPE